MPTYFRPSVYFEETLRPLSDASNDPDPAESAAAFVGRAKGGPNGPVKVTSWSGYQTLFGQVAYETQDLSYAVYSFFANGGSSCYVVRGIASDAVAPFLMLYDGTGTLTTDEVFTVKSQSLGLDPNQTIFVTVNPLTNAPGRFDLTIDVGNTTYLSQSETFPDLSMDPADPRYAIDIVNSPASGSRHVTLVRSPNNTTNATPVATAKVPLTGGSEGSATVDIVAAAQRLEQVDRNLVINLPGAATADVAAVVNWAVGTGRHMVVADVPKPAADETAAASVTAMVAFADALPNSSHVAVYGPWVHMVDPGSSAGSTRLSAPGGAVVAQYLRTDSVRGIHKAPAGIATSLAGVVQPYALYTNTQQDDLAKANVNLIKSVPGSGPVIWGARTQSVNTIDRYVPVRRLLIALKSSINDLTRFAIFENIDSGLRDLVEDVITNYLRTQFDLGALKGANPEQAFFVRCDETNNPPAVEESGQLVIDIGVALKTPAEFVIIRIGQQQSGTVASDSLEEI